MSALRRNPTLLRQILLARAAGQGWKAISASSGLSSSTVRSIVARFEAQRSDRPDLDLATMPDQLLVAACFKYPAVDAVDIFVAQRTPDALGRSRSLTAIARNREFGGLSRTRLSELRAPIAKTHAIPAFVRTTRPAGIVEICEHNRIYRLDDGRTRRVIVAMAPASGMVAARAIDGPDTEKGERDERGGRYVELFLKAVADLFKDLGGVPREIRFVQFVSPSVRHLLQRHGYPELEEFAKHYGVTIPKMHRPRRLVARGKRQYERFVNRHLPKQRGIREFLTMHLGARLDPDALRDRPAFEAAVEQGVRAWNAQKVRPLGLTPSDLYEQIDAKVLGAIPTCDFEHREHKRVLVGHDGHVAIGRARYSVPYQFRAKWLVYGRNRKRSRMITAMVGRFSVELFVGSDRILHAVRRRGYATDPRHLESQNKSGDWVNPGFVRKAERVAGRAFGDVLRAIITSKQYPEQGYHEALIVAKFGSEANREILAQNEDALAAMVQGPPLAGPMVVAELKRWGCTLVRKAVRDITRKANLEPHIPH
jgi:hypothetical protein